MQMHMQTWFTYANMFAYAFAWFAGNPKMQLAITLQITRINKQPIACFKEYHKIFKVSIKMYLFVWQYFVIFSLKQPANSQFLAFAEILNPNIFCL